MFRLLLSVRVMGYGLGLRVRVKVRVKVKGKGLQKNIYNISNEFLSEQMYCLLTKIFLYTSKYIIHNDFFLQYFHIQ